MVVVNVIDLVLRLVTLGGVLCVVRFELLVGGDCVKILSYCSFLWIFVSRQFDGHVTHRLLLDHWVTECDASFLDIPMSLVIDGGVTIPSVGPVPQLVGVEPAGIGTLQWSWWGEFDVP